MKLHDFPEPVNDATEGSDAQESRRLAALRDLGILDTAPEQVFDDLTALAARVCDTPVALVSLVDEQRLCFKSCHGAQPGPTPRQGSLCARAIRGDDLLEVPDTLAAGFDSALLALPQGGIARFYAGVPLSSPDGHKLGVLCVMDRRARTLDEGQRDALRRLGRQAQAALAARRAGAQLLDASRQLERHARLSAIHARSSRLIAQADEAQPMLRAICDAVVAHGGIHLAFVSRPDAQGGLEILASAGRTEHLRDLDARVGPRHRGGPSPEAMAWRRGEAVFVGAGESPPELRAWRERAGRQGVLASATVPILRGDKVWATFSARHVEQHAFDAEARAILVELALDVSRGLDRIDASQREQELSALQRTLLDNTLAGILIVRRRRIVSANRQCARMLGYRDPAELVGLSTRSLCVDDDEFQRIGRLYAQLRRGERVHAMDVRIRRRDGSEVLFDAAAGIAGSRASSSTVWTFVDVTERARLQHQLRHDALHDILSDLPNRRALDEYLPRALARAQRRGKAVAVGVLDLDDFKPVNDTHGHDAGDVLLRELARRLGRSMRKSDMLARLGGDEFVVVLDELDDAGLPAQLQRLTTRLHRAVEAPFALGGDRQARVGMTLGLALFPRDGGDADALLRHADAALYQLKARKRERSSWWQLGVLAPAADAAVDDAAEPDAYGAEAARALHEHTGALRDAVAGFVQAVYAVPSAQRGFAAALRGELERRHAGHLRALFSASATSQEVADRAARLGRAQALVGIQPAQLIEPVGLLRQMLAQACAARGLGSAPRLRLLRVLEQRLQDDLQGQLRAAHRTMGAYFKALHRDPPAPATLWRDALRGLLEPVGALPGILACVVLRPNAHGRFEVEAAAGPQAEQLTTAMTAADYAVRLEPLAPSGQGLVSEAWRTRQVCTSAHLDRDPRVATWHGALRAAGGRSAAAVPITTAGGRCALIVWLLGAYPNQFDAAWVAPFIRSLQYRAAHAWTSTRAAASQVLSQDVAQSWRDRLLDGGLEMHVQPVVDLHTGECLRVEALARLRLASGRVVSPAAFLPILGEQELDWLFRSGLEQVCARLQAWDREGLRVDAAINLPPSCLLNAACAQWVQAVLARHGIEPRRLTLELLETQGMEFQVQSVALGNLKALGVNLAMDDLGAGYSSLQRLAQLPFDSIKIDQGLLLHLRKDPLQTLSLVRAIVRLADELGRTLVVEGVEDRGAIEAAVQCGARYAQGFGIARPMPAGQFAGWLREFRLLPAAGEVHTFLGMLARCRRIEPRAGRDAFPGAGDPVPGFLRERELQHGELARWYARLAARDVPAGASRAWVEWLVRQVALEARHDGPSDAG